MERENRPPAGSTPTTISFVLSHEQFPVDQLLQLGQYAEEVGFDGVSTSDHFHPWQDNQGHAGFAWVTLAALGARTRHLRMGTAVTCPSFRYRPALVAQAFASLGVLNPGRIWLGLGTGEALNEVPSGGGWDEFLGRAQRMVEATEIIRALWSGETVSYGGKHFTVENARLYDVPPQPIPIYLAASGPESMKTAGKHGDGLVTDAESALKPELREAFSAGAREAGKDPETLDIVAENWVIVGDETEARKYAPLWRFIPRAWDLYVDDPSPVSIRERAERDVPLQEVYGSWPVSNDPQVHIDGIQKLLDGGVTQVLIHSPQPDQKAVIDFYAEQVLPKVRRTAGKSGTGARG